MVIFIQLKQPSQIGLMIMLVNYKERKTMTEISPRLMFWVAFLGLALCIGINTATLLVLTGVI